MDINTVEDQILTQIDPETGNVLITIPSSIVKLLKWQSDSSLIYIANPDENTLLAKLS